MSDRQCNLCDFRERERKAKRKRIKLRLVDDRGWKRIESAPVGSTEWKNEEVFYMKVPTTCEC